MIPTTRRLIPNNILGLTSGIRNPPGGTTILTGTPLGIYSGELLVPAVRDERAKCVDSSSSFSALCFVGADPFAFENRTYDLVKRNYIFDIDYWWIGDNQDNKEKKKKKKRAGRLGRGKKTATNPGADTGYEAEYSIDAFHYGNVSGSSFLLSWSSYFSSHAHEFPLPVDSLL